MSYSSTTLKLKVAKSERIYFDGTLISNGHWMYPAKSVKLSRKDLQSLVDAGVKFSDRADGFGAQTGTDACVPNLKAVLPKDLTTRNGDPSKFILTACFEESEATPIDCHNRVTWFDTAYARPIMDAGGSIHPDPEKPLSCAVVQLPGEAFGILMPLRPPSTVSADAARLAELLLGEGVAS